MKKFLFSSLILAFLAVPLTAGAIEFRPPIAATTLNDILNLIIKISLAVVLPLAVIAVLFAAFMILRSQGEIEKVQKGKQILTYGLIGLAVVIVGSGSGVLLKNVFKDYLPKIEIPGVTYKLPSDFNLPLSPYREVVYWTNVLSDEIDKLQQELSDAEQKGDKDKVASLSERIKNLEEQKRSLTLWNEELLEMEKENTGADVAYWEKVLFDKDAGLAFLSGKGVKADKEGWYKMQGGGEYNPQTREYIDATGKVYTDTTLFGYGSIMYCQ